MVLTGASVAFGERLMAPLRAAPDATLPPWLRDVASLVVDEIDDIGWARGVAAVSLRAEQAPERPVPLAGPE
jgi:hypothetical protein